MKRLWQSALLMILLSLFISCIHTTLPWLHLIKCLLLAFGISLLTYALCAPRIHKICPFLYVLGVILLSLYTCFALDTYVFHFLTWFPGMIRYAMFSTYGVWYILFILPGLLLCFNVEEKNRS